MEKFLVEPQHIKNLPVSQRYEFIDKKRKEYFEIQYNENIKFVDLIKSKHRLSSQFLDNIFSSKNDINSLKSFLIKENESPKVGEKQSMKTFF